MKGHHFPVQHSKCAHHFQCQRTLYAGPCAHGANARSSVVYSSSTYSSLQIITSGVLQVPICLHNLTTHSIEIPTKAVVGQVAPANQMPPVVLPTRTSGESNPKPQKGWVLEALDLQGLKKWPKTEQRQAKELLLKWEHLFVHSDLDLGKTALIKH